MQTTTEQPARVAGEISRQLATQERRAAKARQRVRKLRQIASAEIERLIAFMDETDGYTTTELEEGHDAEPSLGFQAGDIFVGRGCESGGSWHDDREVEDEHDEPSLAAPENQVTAPYGCLLKQRDSSGDQSRWASGECDDREGDGCADDREGDELEHGGDEHDGCEPDEDREPSLGWPEAYGCGGAGMGSSDDKEEGPGADVAVAQKRGRASNPGVEVYPCYSDSMKITGLTAQQKQALGTEWVRR